MSRRMLTTGAAAALAGALATVTVLSGTARAVPPESREITVNCLELNYGVTWFWNGNATMTSSDPGTPGKQRLKVRFYGTNPVYIPMNTITTTIRMTQGGWASPPLEFTGKVNAPGPDQVFGPLPAPSRLPAGTSLMLTATAGTPTATNWSLRMLTTLGGVAQDIACTGYQPNGPAFTF
ncbi:hypothetical protein [Embleya hyalina]|uniref:Secreted protein n=1 Tax=Embleya hyalina TaxID=516124 RepID=A0A401YTT0_9ACTN|nr:hypothetical protein [Embleya hyalina]GCD97986.1 hypothetical protein EHYA_05686 [Embleya hyalina]